LFVVLSLVAAIVARCPYKKITPRKTCEARRSGQPKEAGTFTHTHTHKNRDGQYCCCECRNARINFRLETHCQDNLCVHHTRHRRMGKHSHPDIRCEKQVPPVLRMVVRHYAGPLSAAPELIRRVSAGSDPQSVLVLLAAQSGPTLVVRAAYLLVRTAAAGTRWAVVKVVSAGASIGWCFLRKLLRNKDEAAEAEAATAPAVEDPKELPLAAGAPLTPPIIDDYTAEQRSPQEQP